MNKPETNAIRERPQVTIAGFSIYHRTNTRADQGSWSNYLYITATQTGNQCIMQNVEAAW